MNGPDNIVYFGEGN
jgi:hypothetical protein